jgi:hypothetical protein
MGTARSLRPNLRPNALVTKAMARKRKRLKGAVCGDPDIQGEAIGRVPGKLKGCGVQDAVRVRSVAGVTLSQKSVMDCGTAKALKKWINTGAKPSVGSKGGGLSGLKVAAHYSCRTRNNKAGAKISEHGKGRAIDISGLVLNDGRTISVLKGWHNADRRTMRRAHKTACGPFGTVLGPNADRYHQDHFHFDTARYRSGSYFCHELSIKPVKKVLLTKHSSCEQLSLDILPPVIRPFFSTKVPVWPISRRHIL